MGREFTSRGSNIFDVILHTFEYVQHIYDIHMCESLKQIRARGIVKIVSKIVSLKLTLFGIRL